VLHIAGLHHTGSTILANILGEVDGFFAAGELVYLWQMLAFHDRCGCGRPVAECPVWRAILERVFSSNHEATERLRPKRSWLYARNLAALLLEERRGDPRLTAYRAVLGDLCRSIRDETGARVIIETSKRPVYGRILAGAPGVDVYVVHLVRDPRATAYSWLRADMWNAGPLEIGAAWTVWHAVIPHLCTSRGRYFPLRYEDFARSPKETVLRVLAHAGEEGEPPFVDDHTVRLGPNHTCNGNPNRFQTGPVVIRQDDRWRADLGRRRALAATAAAWPLMHRWGYSLRV
jgi:hypothetical protein